MGPTGGTWGLDLALQPAPTTWTMEGFNDDTILDIASFLGPLDLIGLGLVSKRFGAKPRPTGAAFPKEAMSLMDEAARARVEAIATDGERLRAPKVAHPSWIGLLHEMETLRHWPLAFDQLIGRGFFHHNHPRSSNARDSHVIVEGDGSRYDGRRDYTAIASERVMRAGKHCASFAISATGQSARVGVVRPIEGWDERGLSSFAPFQTGYFSKLRQERTEGWDGSSVHCCAYDINQGNCVVSDWTGFNDYHTWAGMRTAESDVEWYSSEVKLRTNCLVGMLLDLDEGTLTVHLNNERLGVMKTGLAGEYCWMITFSDANSTCVVMRGIEKRADWHAVLAQPGAPYHFEGRTEGRSEDVALRDDMDALENIIRRNESEEAIVKTAVEILWWCNRNGFGAIVAIVLTAVTVFVEHQGVLLCVIATAVAVNWRTCLKE
ncbi:hypothetical protein ACHAWF_016920 [Thalassiosira exigua]